SISRARAGAVVPAQVVEPARPARNARRSIRPLCADGPLPEVVPRDCIARLHFSLTGEDDRQRWTLSGDPTVLGGGPQGTGSSVTGSGSRGRKLPLQQNCRNCPSGCYLSGAR